jgi:tRNA-specific 2-thiouridylase
MKKIIVGLSGGVDSAVAVIMLQRQGYDVEGMFMRNWDSSINNDVLGNPNNPNDICPQEVDYMDALKVSEKLGINLHRVDFVEEYWEKVFKYFVDEYRAGRTPNPDILCNKEIKFKAFLEKAEKLGVDHIAMGHYARTKMIDGKMRLLRGMDKNKDQTYFLCQLNQEQISKAVFPIGELNKADVRAIASEANLEVATKKDSTGICFIGERDFKAFLQNYIPAQKGRMEDIKGNLIGYHDGIMYYTIGQRHGLEIGGPGEAWFVIGKKIKDNVLIVGQGTEQEYLYANTVLVTGLNWLGPEVETYKCSAKFRYRQKDNDVEIKFIDKTTAIIKCMDKVKAITPGQAAVFYDGEICLGGGTIDKVYMDDELRQY